MSPIEVFLKIAEHAGWMVQNSTTKGLQVLVLVSFYKFHVGDPLSCFSKKSRPCWLVFKGDQKEAKHEWADYYRGWLRNLFAPRNEIMAETITLVGIYVGESNHSRVSPSRARVGSTFPETPTILHLPSDAFSHIGVLI